MEEPPTGVPVATQLQAPKRQKLLLADAAGCDGPGRERWFLGMQMR